MQNDPNYVTVKSLSFPNAAELYKARLEAADIECFVFNSPSVLPLNTSPVGGILLKVHVDNEKAAKKIIKKLDHDFLEAKSA